MASSQPATVAGPPLEPRPGAGTQFIAQGPQITKLSKENYDKWSTELDNALYLFEAEEHIQKPAAQIDQEATTPDDTRDTRRKRILALNIMIQSIPDQLYKKCIANGYNGKDKDPYKLLQTIQVLMNQTPLHDQLIHRRRLRTMDLHRFNSLEEFWNYAEEVRCKELTLFPDSSENIWIQDIIIGLGDHPVGTRLSHEFGFGRLTLALVCGTIQEAIESERKSGSSYMATTSKKKSKTNDKGTNTKKDQVIMIDCKMCGRKHDKDWPECDHYEHHHPGTCFLMHPELAPPRWKRPTTLPKKKTQTSPTNQPSPAGFDFSGHIASVPVSTNHLQLDANTRNRVMYDTGANRHIFNNKAWFASLRPLKEPVVVDSSSGDRPELTLGGDVPVEVVRSDGQSTRIQINGAVLNESCPCNLVGGELLRDQTGFWHYGYDDRLFADDKLTEVAQLVKCNLHPYFVTKNSPVDSQFPSAMLTVSLDVMHKRLMHASIDRVKQVCRRQGIKIQGTTLECESCAKGKSTEIPHRGPPSRKVTAPLQLVYMDIMVIKPRSINGNDYCLHLIDSYTGYQWALMLPNRMAQTVISALVDWIRAMEKQTGLRVLGFQMDNAKEFACHTADAVFRKNGLLTLFSPPETHEPMGRIERAHRTIAEAARTSLIEAKLPEKLWEHAMKAAVYLANRLPTKANAKNQAPFDKLAEYLGFDMKNDLSFIRTWGCKAYVHLKGNRHPDRARKMLPRAEEGRLVGWIGDAGHVYQVYLPDKNKVIRARDVRFIEGATDDDTVQAICEPIRDDGDGVPNAVNTGYWVTTVGNTHRLEQVGNTSTSATQAPPLQAPAGQTRAQWTLTPDPECEEEQFLKELDDRQFQQQCSPDPTPYKVTFRPQTYVPGGVPPLFRDTVADAMQPDQLSQQLDQFHISDQRMEGSPFNDSQYIQAPRKLTQAPAEAERLSRTVRQSNVDAPPQPMAPRKPACGTGYDDSPIPINLQDHHEPPVLSSPVTQPETQPTRKHPRRKTAYKGTYNVDDLIDKNTFLAQGYTQMDTYAHPHAMALLADFEATGASDQDVPDTYGQARKSKEWPHWKVAFEKEFHDLTRRHTWDLVYPQPGDVVLPGKWVLKIKHLPDQPPRHKARWVVCGNRENTNGWEIQDTYSATAHSVAVRFFLWLVAVKDLECEQFDMVTAYLHSRIPKGIRVLVRQPTGFSDGTARVCLLRNALYGLVRSSLWWYDTITSALIKLGFQPLQREVCIFVNQTLGAYLLLYVDDVLIAAPDQSVIEHVTCQLGELFELKRMGPVRQFLGIEITRDRSKRLISLRQQTYTRKILARFAGTDLKPKDTPWPTSLSIPLEWDVLEHETSRYRQQVGCTNWLASYTRPDIAFAVGKLAKGSSGPGEHHLRAMKHLLRYLAGTSSMALQLGGAEHGTLTAFADAAYADEVGSRYSTAGHIVFLDKSPIAWQSKVQTLVTTSTTEAEFINLTPAGKTLLWIAHLLAELDIKISPKILFTDSANAMSIVLNPLCTARTRHIDIKYKWIIDMVKKKMFDIAHVETDKMAADGLTKPFWKEKHLGFVRMIGLSMGQQ